ncbi:MAG: hypothetical protein PHO70_08370 [Candidatus Omnitrophica bacterium]|nr:hypothetical protein [Candidatus Omnitrophota bacterium]
MDYTLEMVMKGDAKILKYYENAEKLWQEIMSSPKANDLTSLAKLISNQQFCFEGQCGGKDIGQEVMAVSGILRYYSTASGWEDNFPKAKLVYEAIKKSNCSLEIKSDADSVAEHHHFNE